MEHAELRDLLIAHPFVPFTVHMTDGTEFFVRHPERAMLSDETLYVHQDGQTIRCALINISRVVTSDPIEQ